MPHRDRYLFVCTNRREEGNPKGSCAQKGSEELIKALKNPEFESRMRGLGMELYGTTPQQFAQFIKDENAKWAKVIKATGARID